VSARRRADLFGLDLDHRYSKYWQEQFGMLAAALEEIGSRNRTCIAANGGGASLGTAMSNLHRGEITEPSDGLQEHVGEARRIPQRDRGHSQEDARGAGGRRAEEVADYQMATLHGPVRLSELFAARPTDRHPQHGHHLPNCTLWADGLNGIYHIGGPRGGGGGEPRSARGAAQLRPKPWLDVSHGQPSRHELRRGHGYRSRAVAAAWHLRAQRDGKRICACPMPASNPEMTSAPFGTPRSSASGAGDGTKFIYS